MLDGHSAAPRRALYFEARSGSTLLVRVEDVVLCLHWRMARESAVRRTFGIGGELVRWGIVVEHRVAPPAAFCKSLAVLFHDESLLKDVWHIHDEGSLRALLRRPLELRDLGTVRERLAVARNAGLERLDHDRIANDHLEPFVGSGRRDDCPVLVSPEIGERDSARGFQRVLVVVLALREKDHGAEDGQYCRGCDDGKAGDALHPRARCNLLFFLLLPAWFRHKFVHGLFSFTAKVL